MGNLERIQILGIRRTSSIENVMALLYKSFRDVKTQKFIFSNYCVTFSRPKTTTNKDLPWIQTFSDVFTKDPLHHRLVGMFLLRRVLKQAKVPFNLKDFTLGVKEAVKVVSDCVQSKDQEKLQSLLGAALHRQYKSTFIELKSEKKDIYLKLSAFKGIQIAGARFIFGHTEPGDEYILNAFGQKIVLSKNEMDDFEEEKSGNISMMEGLSFGKKFGEGAFLKRIRFQFDVKFQTRECYELVNEGEEFNEEDHIAVVYHKWKFETPILYSEDDSQVLDWTIVDMDDYLKNKYKTEVIEED